MILLCFFPPNFHFTLEKMLTLSEVQTPPLLNMFTHAGLGPSSSPEMLAPTGIHICPISDYPSSFLSAPVQVG